MKIQRLSIVAALTTALSMVIVLNQNRAEAQGSSTPGPVGCGQAYSAESGYTIDQTESQACGGCTVYTVDPNWTPGNGSGAKYIVSQQAATGIVQHCKFSQNTHDSCTEISLTGEVTCPPPPDDYNTGTGSSTGTGTSTHL